MPVANFNCAYPECVALIVQDISACVYDARFHPINIGMVDSHNLGAASRKDTAASFTPGATDSERV